MTKKVKLLLGLVKWLVALLFLALILADLHFEVNGLPDSAVHLVRSWLAREGVNCEIRTVRAGLFRGVILSDLRLRVDRLGPPVIFECLELRFRPFIAKLLKGRVEFRQAAVQSGTLRILDHGSKPHHDALTVDAIEGLLHMMRSGGIGLELTGNAEGIQVNLHGTLRNMDSLLNRPPSQHEKTADAPTPVGNDPAPENKRALPDDVWRVVDFIRKCDFTERDAVVNVRIAADAAALDRLKVDGDIRLYDAVVGGVVIRRFRGRFDCNRERLSLDTATLLLSRDERVSGSIRVELAERTVQARLEGRATPASVMYILRRDMSGWPAAVSPETPVTFSATLTPSPLRPSDWTVTGTAHVERMRIRDLLIRRADLSYSYRDGICRLSDMNAVPAGSEDDEFLRGNVVVDLRRERISGSLTCALHIPSRVSQIDPGFGRRLRTVHTGDEPLTVTLNVEESPYSWTGWRAAGRVSTPELVVDDLYCRHVSGALELRDGQLSVRGLRWHWPGTPEDFATVDLSTNLTDATDGDQLDIQFGLRAKTPDTRPDYEGKWREGMDLNGRLALRGRNRLSAQLSGTLYPSSLYRLLRKTFRLPRINVEDKLTCLKDPVQIDLRMPEFVLHTRKWAVEGSISGHTVRYDILDLESVRSTVSLSPAGVTFSDIAARTNRDVELSLNVDVRFDPLQVRISDGSIVGDPQVVQAFVEPQEAREIYARVWRDVTWHPDFPPTVTLPSLIYRDAVGPNWQLTMDSRLQAEKASYKDLRIRKLDLGVRLNLPRDIRIDDVRVETEKGVAKGDVHIAFTGAPKCEFRITDVQGGADPKRILHLINEDWDPYLADVEFAPDSTVVCQGSFFLSGEPMVRISGTLKTPFASYKGLALEDLESTWRVTPGTIGWDVTQSRVFDGDMQLTGVYDIANRTGHIALNSARMSFPAVMKRFHSGSKENGEPLPGLMSVNCRLQILHGWAGKDLQLMGNGRLSITESDLWRVPLLTGLGRLLDMTMLNRLTGGRLSSLGTITRLDADLDFNGDRLLVPNLKTDGTIVSLRGSGEYSWESSRLFFQVTGHTLSKVGILSFALRPLSWVFNAELTGTTDDYKWRMVTAFEKALSGDSDEGLPPLEEAQ